ncbi:MAG: response regulator [Nautilia sp.]|nr:MAG: response regulator [Nautilia sp.]
MKRILIVDDDMINRKLLSVIIKKSGDYEVIEAENGLEALNIIKNEPIDMILLDIIMPVMDGIDLLKIIKDDSNYQNIPVSILTTDDTRKPEVLSLGANSVLIKPIKETEIKDLLEKYL